MLDKARARVGNSYPPPVSVQSAPVTKAEIRPVPRVSLWISRKAVTTPEIRQRLIMLNRAITGWGLSRYRVIA